MSAVYPPFQPGDSSTNAIHAADLGKSYRDGPRTFILVKAGADLASPKGKAVAAPVSGSAHAKVLNFAAVDITTTAFDPGSLGVVPAEYGTTTIKSGTYYLVQTGGLAIGIAAGAIVAGAAVGTSTTAGDMDDAGAVAGAALGTALEAATNPGDLFGVLLTPRI